MESRYFRRAGRNPALEQIVRQKTVRADAASLMTPGSSADRITFGRGTATDRDVTPAAQSDASDDISVVIADSEAMPMAWRVMAIETELATHKRLMQRLARFAMKESNTSPWLSEVERELLLLKQEASADDWDGEASLMMTDRAWQVARQLLHAIHAFAPRPSLGIGRRGQVALDWWGPDEKTLTVEIDKDGQIIFAALYGDDSVLRGRAAPSEITEFAPAAIEFALAQTFQGA